jgi:hypothetical protein
MSEKVMESYQTWFGESPELAILRMLGLFDRPADEQTFGVLLKSPVIARLRGNGREAAIRPNRGRLFDGKRLHCFLVLVGNVDQS